MTTVLAPSSATAAPQGAIDAALEAVREAVRLPAGSRIVAAMSGGVDSTVTAALLGALLLGEPLTAGTLGGLVLVVLGVLLVRRG